MLEILLSSKVPMQVEILNTKFTVSNIKQKLLKFDTPTVFNLQYNFDGKNSIVYCAEFTFKNNNLLCDNKNFKIIKYDENKFLVQILQKNCNFLQKKVKKLQIDDAFFNFYQNGLIEIETKNEMLFTEIYDFEIVNAEVVILNNGYYALKLFGDSDAVVVLNDKFFDVGFYQNSIIEKTEHGFKLLTDLKDIAKHGLVKEFKIQNGLELVEEYSVYLQGKPILPSNLSIIPLYFLECIKAKDYTMAKGFLCDDLKNTATQEHLINFFGDFTDILLNSFNNDSSVLCLEYCQNQLNFTKDYNFLIKDEKIYNIK